MARTIVLTGAGSGGHITPIQAVAAELKRQDSTLQLVYIGQKGDGLGDIPAADPNIDASYTIRAGKFRRYHGEGWKQLLDLPTMFLNARDAIYVLIGLFQSRKLLKTLQPEVIFIKGGFVGVPVGLSAAMLHVPFVTHDSDAVPGLANRIIARWAAVHAVALPKEVYGYDLSKTETTGIPLQADFQKVTASLKRDYRQEIDVPASAKLLFVIGGGLGAQRVNQAVTEAVPHLLHEFSDLYVVHGAGRNNEQVVNESYDSALSDAQRKRVRVFGYLSDVYRYSGASDIVVTRAGATNLAEFALQAKACVVIPSPFLTGGHQLKNAAYLEEKQAAVVLDELDASDDPNRLSKVLSDLLRHPDERERLSKNFADFAHPHAAQQLSAILLRELEKRAAS